MANKITDIANVYSENLLPNFLTFNGNVDYTGWNVSSGVGTGTNVDTAHYSGDRSLLLFSTDKTQTFTVNSGGTQTRFTAAVTGRYLLQFWVNVPVGGNITGNIFTLSISKNGAGGFLTSTVNGSDTPERGKWYGFWVEINLLVGDYIDFSFTIPINAAGDDHAIYVDGMKIELDDKFIATSTIYSEPALLLPPIPADGQFLIDRTSGITTVKEIKLVQPQIDFPNVVSLGSQSSDYSPGFEITAGARMIVNAITDSVAGSGLIFTARRKTGSTNQITITAHNPTGSDINPASSYFNVTILP